MTELLGATESFLARRDIFDQRPSSVLMLEMPSVEDVAKAIWQRQRNALDPAAISYSVQWRDPSIPQKFWDEFVLDAYAVLLLLIEKHTEYENPR